MNNLIVPEPALRFLRSFAALLLLGSAPLAAQPEGAHERGGHSFSIGETGSISQLGVHIEVKPLASGEGIFGFEVSLSYKDPFYDDSPESSFLNPKFFHTSCAVSREGRELGNFAHTNERKTRFEVRLVQGCKETPAGLPVPFLELNVRCSNAAKELRYLRAREEGRLFDISPTGYWTEVRTESGAALALAQDAYNVVSTVLVILDVVAVTRGTLTAGKFLFKVVSGIVVDEAVNSTFDYLQSEYGMRPEFHHTGWWIVCRLCGHRFHRHTLVDGEHLKCPNSGCRAEVILHTH